MRRHWQGGVGLTLVVAGIVAVGGLALAAEPPPRQPLMEFHDVRAQTEEFHRYYHTIQLSREQEAVMKEALLPLPAACCKDRSAYTRCCKCNMGRSWWGLSKHLIADRGLGAEEVRTAVAEWMKFIHPDGADGRACYSGRCRLPFKKDGCGGMSAGQVAF